MKIWKKITEEQYVELLKVGVHCTSTELTSIEPSPWESSYTPSAELEYYNQCVKGKSFPRIKFMTYVEVDDNDSTVSCTLSENQST